MQYLLNIGTIVRHHNLAKYMDKEKYNVYIISSSAVHNSDLNFITDNKKYKISNIDGVNYVHIKANQYNGNGLKRIISILQFYWNTKRSRRKLEKEIKSVRTEITNITKNNNKVVSALSQDVIKYAEELGLGNQETIPASYLFTSNLKELSGAVLHKTAFAFRLAYIIAIENALKIKLPIILDSPSGKEVDHANIKLMMDILKRDFADHQIIIASIFEYDFEKVNSIEIRERLIEANM